MLGTERLLSQESGQEPSAMARGVSFNSSDWQVSSHMLGPPRDLHDQTTLVIFKQCLIATTEPAYLSPYLTVSVPPLPLSPLHSGAAIRRIVLSDVSLIVWATVSSLRQALRSDSSCPPSASRVLDASWGDTDFHW